MYTSFFGLNEKPFSITPDPRYLFMSERHTEGLAHLLYGVNESGGFIQLTGEVGTGKTTLVRSLLAAAAGQRRRRADPESAAVPHRIPERDLRRARHRAAEQRDSIKALTTRLNAFLLSNHGRGRRTILIVDEAQNLRVDVLEQVRLLTNLETAKQKAAADHPDRPAGAARSAGPQRHAPAGSAHHRPLSPRTADPRGNDRVHRSPPACCRSRGRSLRAPAQARAVPATPAACHA